MIKLELTQEQMLDFASKIFALSFPDGEYGKLRDNAFFVVSDWVNEAYDAVDAYNCVVKNVDFPDISVMKNCCLICKHVDLYRPACNYNGCDINLACVCSHFELFEFEEDEE